MTRPTLLTAITLATLAAGVATLAALRSPAVSYAAVPADGDDRIARGEYLVRIMVCNDCHTPWAMTARGPEPDMTRMLSGHPEGLVIPEAPAAPAEPWTWGATATNTAFAGPWGVSFTANLTPDRETGLGTWTEETFIAALRNGRHEGQGRPILPPMPWPMYRQATDEDLGAIFAYLQSIPPVRNRVPSPLAPAEAR